jgi:signal transduction histidine kinase
MSTTQARKLVLQCDRDGCVVHADAESGTLLGQPPFGELLPLLLDPASAAKCERFLQRARFGGAFGWELHLRARADAPLLFAGQPLSHARILVVAAETHPQLLQLLDACCAQICDASLAIERASPGYAAPPPFSPLDELTRVNSALLGLQRELAKRNAELTAITRQRNELLAVAAHDLRNPLLVVQGYCDILSAGRSLAPDAQHGLERVQRAAELMQHVLEDTLEYARLENDQQRPRLAKLDLSMLARETADGYRALAERKQIQLLFSAPDDLPPLRLDATNVQQIIGNLLSNAIKYSEPGSQVQLALQRRGGDVVLSVRDQGQGISEAEVPLLFRPFQTTSARPTAGETSTGLGLAIVRKLVEANGGEISVSSSLHRGSTFSVTFPSTGAAERRKARSGRGPQPHPRSTRGQS